MPAVPAPSGRRAAPTADSTPSMAMALASIPPSATPAKTTASTSSSSAPNSSGAIVASPNVPGATTKGQKKATNPMKEARTITTAGGTRGRMAAGRQAATRRLRPGRQVVATWSMVRTGAGARIFATWGAKAGEATIDFGGRAVGHDVAGRHHHDPVGRRGRELDVMGGDDDGPALGHQLVEDRR